MSRRIHLDTPHYGGIVHNPIRGCGFSNETARIAPIRREEKAVVSKYVHEYTTSCAPVPHVNIARVAQFQQVDNAMFLVGGTNGSALPLQGNFQFNLSSDVVNYTGGNAAVYALIKTGGDSATHFSTDNLAVAMPQLAHFFAADGIQRTLNTEASFEIALDSNQNFGPRTVEYVEITSEPSCADSAVHLKLVVNDCGLLEKEQWILYPLLSSSGDTLRGMNLAEWINTPTNFVDSAILPARTTNRGTIIIPEIPEFVEEPKRHCGVEVSSFGPRLLRRNPLNIAQTSHFFG